MKHYKEYKNEFNHAIRVVKLGSVFKVIRDILFLGLLGFACYYIYWNSILIEGHHNIQNQYFQALSDQVKEQCKQTKATY